EAGAVEPAGSGHDDVVEVALAAAVSLHRVEAKLERRDSLRAVGATDGAVHRALDGNRARLDQLGPVIDLVESVERVDAPWVGDRDEAVELPVVLDREGDSLLVGEAPEDLGGNRGAEVRVQLGEAIHGGSLGQPPSGPSARWSRPDRIWIQAKTTKGRTAPSSGTTTSNKPRLRSRTPATPEPKYSTRINANPAQAA